jgi:hypothetical protein
MPQPRNDAERAADWNLDRLVFLVLGSFVSIELGSAIWCQFIEETRPLNTRRRVSQSNCSQNIAPGLLPKYGVRFGLGRLEWYPRKDSGSYKSRPVSQMDVKPVNCFADATG